MEVSDLNILKEYRKNSRKGLELVYDRYRKYVYAIAYHYSGNKEDALDITQEVFISVFKAMDGFKEQYSLLPWIKKITVNKCLNFLRSRKESLSLNETTDSGDELQNIILSKEFTENTVVCKDTKKVLEEAIQRLPDKERMAVLLRHMKQMKYEEIAKTMKLPPGTVKTLIHKGRKAIKQDLVMQGVWEV
ncbi:RNA polymerase sigma-70 factor (ECF subfamily) [Ruminiclostridium sufflavum DSM 19573]|uniref:RNA polymerase sigma factor n=1 Tax=Ruminiclostridium sufflavum DSM 19573 TaxID=1121337 RepID=A0A318XKT9_9FIRM|nr:RNA polymerase sigma factor [Ruminiclostridium sufflavum]PYG88143.1 RNA polymerase sigma-70 factor (ECF subfamily) [Ruminiclostridium sufflavum DSM 19573]